MPPLAEDFPAPRTLKAGDLSIEIQPPDAARGWHRGTRFNWSGQTTKIVRGGTEFIHPWKDGHDPTAHDDVTGLADEFGNDGPQGYDAAPPGGTFVKIGIGVLKRPDARPYEFWRSYPIAEPPRWTVEFAEASATFRQELRHEACSCRYEKRVTLVEGGQATVAHALTNLGTRPLKTSHYCHHFFRISGDPIGPTTRLEFPGFLPRLEKPTGRADLFSLDGRKLTLSAAMPKGASAMTAIVGFGAENPHAFTLSNLRTGAAVEATGDRPLSKFALWTVPTTFCPEPYVALDIAPGETANWETRYRFRAGK